MLFLINNMATSEWPKTTVGGYHRKKKEKKNEKQRIRFCGK